ncbi:MAG: hypothetical protein ACRDPF_15430 [Streptosporangiaceae bacterium]
MDAAFMLLELNAVQLKLIMKIGLLPNAGRTLAGRWPDAVKPGFHCVRTHWIRGFMAFQLDRRTRTVVLIVPV